MADKEKTRHSHSNLPGRVESPAIEIYASTGMPKENVMPAYTHTQTFGHTISFTTGERLMNLPPSELYKLSEESLSDYYREAKEVYSDIVKTAHDELDLWCIKMEYVQKSPPTAAQYDKKIDLLCQSLDPIEIDGTSYVSTSQMIFPHGLIDKKDCGQYLIINGCTPKFVKLLSGIEYLMLKKVELLNQQPSAATKEKPLPFANEDTKAMDKDTASEETEDKSIRELLHTVLVEKFHFPPDGDDRDITFGEKTYSQGQVLAMVQTHYKKLGLRWAKSRASFCRETSPVLNISPEAMQMRISRATERVRNIPLDNITKQAIKDTNKRWNDDQAEDEYNKWEGLPELVAHLAQQ